MWQEQTGRKSNEYTIMEQIVDEGVLAENARLREIDACVNSTQLHEGEKIEYYFRIPSMIEWTRFLRSHQDIAGLLDSADESDRMKGARMLSILQPEWVIKKRH